MGTHVENLRQVDRRALEKAVESLGSDCAAARALAEADAHDGPVRFFLYQDQILVEKHKPSSPVSCN